jgi:transcriptional regulator with XRE-family HTH domain
MSMTQARNFRGDRLRMLRKAKGMSQSFLGGRIGAHVTSISDWERGANEPSGRHVASLARELGVAAEHFYADEDDDEESDLMASLVAAFRAVARNEALKARRVTA